VNVSGGGTFYFTSVSVSNIPVSCYGKDFTISAYNSSSSSPLPIFNTNATRAVVYNNAGTFELGDGTTTGASITSQSGKFTLTFTTPVAASVSVNRLTIQSSDHAQPAGEYSVGDNGPGGGKIFYYSAVGFNCGTSFSATGSPTNGKCHYLESAPKNWDLSLDGDGNQKADFSRVWSIPAYETIATAGIDEDDLQDITGSGRLTSEIGLGLKNSIAIVSQNGAYNASTRSYAAGAARAYRGGSKSDWYLPSPGDWEKMASALSSTDLPLGLYWLSSEKLTAPVRAFWGRPDVPSFTNIDVKSGTHVVRPVRAF
jgi:hypothetical protein